MKNKIIKLIASCCYLGYAPYAPGTFGSLFAMGIYFLVKHNPALFITAISVITLIGFFVSGRAEKLFNYKDAAQIVIDEAAGMLIALLFVPYDKWVLWFSFFLFRLFDVIKPYPLKKLQHLKGAWGIMLDDIGAGIYTNICIQLFLRLAVYSAS